MRPESQKQDTPMVKPAGVCIPWQEKMKELPPIQGDTELVERVWKDVDGLAYIYVWHCLVSF